MQSETSGECEFRNKVARLLPLSRIKLFEKSGSIIILELIQGLKAALGKHR